MVRANCANTNAEIRALFHPIRRPEDRRSMHPPRPREAERVARWLWGQRRAHLGALRAFPTLSHAQRARGPIGCVYRRNLTARERRRRRLNDRPRQGPRAMISGEDK